MSASTHTQSIPAAAVINERPLIGKCRAHELISRAGKSLSYSRRNLAPDLWLLDLTTLERKWFYFCCAFRRRLGRRSRCRMHDVSDRKRMGFGGGCCVCWRRLKLVLINSEIKPTEREEVYTSYSYGCAVVVGSK
jgi:bacterioferritin-associated ferredoxin